MKRKKAPPVRAQCTEDLYRVVEALLTHVAFFGKPYGKTVRIPYKSIMPKHEDFNDCTLVLDITAKWDNKKGPIEDGPQDIPDWDN